MESKLEDSILGDPREVIEGMDERPTFNIGIAYCILTTSYSVELSNFLYLFPGITFVYYCDPRK